MPYDDYQWNQMSRDEQAEENRRYREQTWGVPQSKAQNYVQSIEPSTGFWGSLGNAFKATGRAIIGGLEDVAEWAGFDQNPEPWVPSWYPQHVPSYQQRLQSEIQRNRSQQEYQVAQTGYVQTELVEAQDILEYNLLSSHIDEVNAQNERDRFELEQKQQAIENRNFNVTTGKNIVDSISDQIAKYQSPAIIQTLFQNRQAQTYIPGSGIRNRGSSGVL